MHRNNLILVSVTVVLCLLTGCGDGASVDVLESASLSSMTPHEAAKAGNVSQLKALASVGKDLKAHDENLESPLHVAARNSQTEAVRMLISVGAPLDTKNLKGMTPLDLAIETDSVHIVELFMQQEIQVDARKPNSTMHRAAQHGNARIVDLLLTRTDSPREWTGRYMSDTPLHVAVAHSHCDVVDSLLKNGAAAIAPFGKQIDENLFGKSLIAVAITNGHMDVADALFARSPTQIRYLWMSDAARDGQVKLMDYLLDEGAAITKPGEFYSAPLVKAATNGHVKIVTLMVEKAVAKHSEKRTLLATAIDAAAKANQAGVVQALLKHGANVTDMTAGAQPLHAASEAGSTAVVRLLLKAEADANAMSPSKRMTPLHLALQRGHSDIANSLLDAGADVKIKTGRGLTCLELANKSPRIRTNAQLLERLTPE